MVHVSQFREHVLSKAFPQSLYKERGVSPQVCSIINATNSILLTVQTFEVNTHDDVYHYSVACPPKHAAFYLTIGNLIDSCTSCACEERTTVVSYLQQRFVAATDHRRPCKQLVPAPRRLARTTPSLSRYAGASLTSLYANIDNTGSSVNVSYTAQVQWKYWRRQQRVARLW